MARGNSARRNSAFDLTKAEFIRPQTRIDANRWLDKATFGAATAITNIEASTKTNIVPIGNDEAVDLMNNTYAAYLDAAYLAEPKFNIGDVIVSRNSEEFGPATAFGGQINPIDGTTQTWMIVEGVYGPARARIKATYALSQMIVGRRGISGHNDAARFAQILFNATKSANNNSFLKMLKEVTYSTLMGNWLTYSGNAKANAATGARPDENYAREIMQLYSIGLDCLNLDGTPLLDGNGEVIPTYTADYVSEAAKFFTGFAIPAVAITGGNMILDGFFHEIASKKAIAWPDGSTATLPTQTYYRFGIEDISNPNGYVVTVLNANSFTVNSTTPIVSGRTTTYFRGTQVGYWKADGVVQVSQTSEVAANTTLVTINKTGHGLVTGDVIYSKNVVEASIDFFLDRLTNHPSCAPFFARNMIKLLVTNNPSPEYIRRVASKFLDNGNGVRGDISAVMKAIFLDRECIIPYGKNAANHGRYTTMFDRFMKVANNLRNDCVHYYHGGTAYTITDRIPVWGNPDKVPSAQSKIVRAIFTEPNYKWEYSGCVPARSYNYPLPFGSPSVFNFYRPGYVPPQTTLGNLGLTAPELQITTPESQTIWTNIVLGATAYHDLVFSSMQEGISAGAMFTGENMDPRGGAGKKFGLNFSLGTTMTVTQAGVATNTLYGTTNFKATVTLEDAINYPNGWQVAAYHRRLGGYLRLGLTSPRPTTAGTFELNFNCYFDGFYDRSQNPPVQIGLQNDNTVFQVGDILDCSECFVMGETGFTGVTSTAIWQPYQTLFHKAASQLPDAQVVTDAQLDVGINYLEGIFMPREISPELRQLMRDAANLPITLPSEPIPGAPAAVRNNYRYMIYGYAQIRIRRMIATLLVSPEFLTQL
jgi:hypothetical protein